MNTNKRYYIHTHSTTHSHIQIHTYTRVNIFCTTHTCEYILYAFSATLTHKHVFTHMMCGKPQHIQIYTNTPKHTDTQIYPASQPATHTHTHTHKRNHTRTHTYTHTHAYLHTHTNTDTHTHTHVHTHIQKYSYLHNYTHEHTHNLQQHSLRSSRQFGSNFMEEGPKFAWLAEWENDRIS